jgi:hypothetical protein
MAGASDRPSCADDMAPATAQNIFPPPSMWRQYDTVADFSARALKFW